MISAARKFFSLASNTARDIMRQPVIAMLMLACLVTVGFLPVVAVFSLGQEERIVRDGALASVFVYGLFLVVACSVASISRQIRSGTAAGVLSKPVGRELFLGATLGGIILVIAFFTTIGITAAMLSVRMAVQGIVTDWLVGVVFASSFLLALGVAAAANFYGRNFCSALFKTLLVFLLAALAITIFLSPAGHFLHFGESAHHCAYDAPESGAVAGQAPGAAGGYYAFLCWRLLPAGFLLFLALAIMAALAVALSTRFKPVVVLFCCALVFILGLISDYLFNTLAAGRPWAVICSAVLPDWQSLGIYEVLDGTLAAVWERLCRACVYALLYVSAVFCLGFMAFKNAEV